MKSAQQLADEIKETFLNGTLEDAVKLIQQDREDVINKAANLSISPTRDRILNLKTELPCYSSTEQTIH